MSTWSVLTALFRLTWGSFPLARRLRNRRRFPGFQLADSVDWVVDGDLVHGEGSCLGEATVLRVREQCRFSIGEKCYIGRYCEIAPGPVVEIGDHTSIQDRTVIFGDVRIGRYCTLAYNIYISSGTHQFRWNPSWLIKDQDRAIQPAERTRGTKVVIHDDCWLGINVVVLPGVTVGKGCVIGANAVVTGSLPPYSVAAGAPARVVGKRLEFLAPRVVKYDSDRDLPYFYSGFHIAQKELEESRSHGGICASEKFSLWLDRSEAQRIHLRGKAVGRETCELHCGGQVFSFGPNMTTFAFDCERGDGPLDFVTLPEQPGPALLVEKAWVE